MPALGLADLCREPLLRLFQRLVLTYGMTVPAAPGGRWQRVAWVGLGWCVMLIGGAESEGTDVGSSCRFNPTNQHHTTSPYNIILRCSATVLRRQAALHSNHDKDTEALKVTPPQVNLHPVPHKVTPHAPHPPTSTAGVVGLVHCHTPRTCSPSPC